MANMVMSARRVCILIVVSFVSNHCVISVMSMTCDDDVISCPCGSDGRNTVVTIKRCFNTNTGCLACDGRNYTTVSVCDQFRYCKTCYTNKDRGCESCPEGVYGKRCLHEQTCGPPPSLENGFHEGSDWVEDGRARYYCKHQWILSGDFELVCRNGRWTGKIPTCELSCGPPPYLSNGEFGASNWTEGAQALYRCAENWFIQGDSTLVCRNGKWSGQIPTCLEGCGQPPDIPNGHYVGSNWANRGRVRYYCRAGRFLTGHPELFCDGSRWIGVVPSCGCGQPPTLHNGRYEGDRWNEGDRVQYYCNDRWVLSGDSELVCREGLWSGRKPTCALGCGQPPNLHNGRYEGSIWNEGDRVQYYCNNRWVLSGDSELVCREGRWSGRKPTCEITCPSPEGESIVVSPVMRTYTSDTTISVNCKPGFTSEESGAILLTCTSGGVWDRSHPGVKTTIKLYLVKLRAEPVLTFTGGGRFCFGGVCRKIAESTQKPCSVPVSPNNGRVVVRNSLTGLSTGQRAEFICDKGYSLFGMGFSVCRGDGTWSVGTPRCVKEVSCADPGIPEGGQRSTKLPRLGGSVRTGGTRAESRVRLGQRGSAAISRNSVQLPLPAGQLRIYTTLSYSCNSTFYKLVGSSQRICQPSGEWSGKQPSCQPVCGKPKRLKSATIVNGKVARRQDWPWQAFIAVRQANGVFFGACAGSIINELWVVTVAHCVLNKRPTDLNVYLGKHFRDNNRDDNSVRKFEVSSITVHPNYNAVMLDFDIALLKLSTKATFTSRISPICLPSFDSDGERLSNTLINPGSVLTITGWGQTENRTASEVLRVAQVRTISNTECHNKYVRSGIPIPVTENMFCAGQPDGETDACYGDSGGPAMAISGSGDNRKWYLVGIVSWGSPIDCAVVNQYGGYTRISRVLKFIGDTIR